MKHRIFQSELFRCAKWVKPIQPPVARKMSAEIKSVDSLWYDGTDPSQSVSTQSMEVMPERDRIEPFEIPREEVTFIQPISETSCPYVRGCAPSHQSLGNIWQGSLKGKKVAIKGLPTNVSSATKKKFEPELHQYLVAKGVRFLHSQDPPVLHTNLTCQTVFLDHQGNAKVSGYGFAELRELITNRTQRLSGAFLRDEMARCYMASGTMDTSGNRQATMADADDEIANLQQLFIADEILEGHTPTMASDVYSFGMLCWLLLTNGKVHARDCRPPLGLPQDVPAQLETLIEQCLSRDTLRRPTFQVIGYVLRTVMLQLKHADTQPPGVQPDSQPSGPMIWDDDDPPPPTNATTEVPLPLESVESTESTESSQLRVESHLFDFDTDTYGVLDSRDVMDGEYEEAVKWFERGAEYGHAPSQSYLGQCYYEGRGTVRLCQKTGVAWWLLAAAQGHVHALYNLGIASFRGKGRPQSYSEAVSWWLRAAGQGHTLAEFNLGSCFQQGLGAKRSAYDAIYWYAQAAAQNNRSAMYNVALMLYQNPQLNELKQGLAAVWLHTAARKAPATDHPPQGHVAAQSLLGRCYEQGHAGLGIRKSLRRAINWHLIAAEKWCKALLDADAVGQCYLGTCYLQGTKYLAQDEESALVLLCMAGTKGNGQACYLLGQFYEVGSHGVGVDPEQAFQWYTRGSQRNHAECRTALLTSKSPRPRSDSLTSNTL